MKKYNISDFKIVIEELNNSFENKQGISEVFDNCDLLLQSLILHFFYSNKNYSMCQFLLNNANNKEILSFYHNSTIFVKAIDNNNSVEIIYQYNDEIITTESNTLSCSKDGNYVIYAKDAANNTSATIEFQIDTILPTITKIESNLIQGTSFNTREKQITITGSEDLSCYKLGYKGVDSPFYTALNDNESSFTINLKKGVNTLTICDLAGNESLTYEINYSPRFFQDTQLLLIVFSSIAALFVILIIVVYTIKNKRKLIK
jgi:hypothetical protein